MTRFGRMKGLWIFALFALALSSGPAAAEQPAVGDLFDAPSTAEADAFQWRFRGWRYTGRGAALGTGRFVLFTDDRTYIIAATEVITPSREFAHDGIQRIVATRHVIPLPGERRAIMCDFVTLSPVLAFYTGNIARGFFVVGNEIIEKRWFTEGDCYDNPD